MYNFFVELCKAAGRVAIARKLAILLYIMLRDGIDYEEFCRRGSHAGMVGDVALAGRWGIRGVSTQGSRQAP